MRFKTLFAPAAFGTLGFAALASIGCGGSAPNNEIKVEAGLSPDNPDVNVGAALFEAKAAPKLANPAAIAGEPLIIGSATVHYDQRQQVAAEVDGKIDLLAVRDDAINPADPLCVYHPRDVNKQVRYRKLREGQTITAGQVIIQLDDLIVQTKRDSAQISKGAAEKVRSAAELGLKYSRDKLALTLKAAGGSSPSEVLQDQITVTRFEENHANAEQSIAKADADYKEASVILKKHHISSVVSGVVRNIAHFPGDFVKAGEKILEVQSTDVVRLEGSLDVQYAPFVKAGMEVGVEPAIASSPVKSHHSHRKEITGIAVSANPGRPLIVSASADGTARVWDVTKNAPLHNLPHPVPVRSVACSPAGSAPLAVTGGDDGKVRLWSLANADALPTESREASEKHSAAVGAIAFSPDGQFFATAAGREVFIWSAADAKKLYALPAEHRDTITSLSFTPQGTLVTASKDRSLKVWKLGAEKAGVVRTIDHRSGILDIVGVSSDGGRVVFDQDKDRLDIVSVGDRATFGQVQNSSPTAAFATLAVFNPADTMLATAGGDGELKGGLQIWSLPPAGGRGSEVARLFTPNRVPATAAAFSPVKDGEHSFLVVGTSAGGVHLWKRPTDRKPYVGKVVFVESSDANKLNVRVEMANPKELNLMDRSTANVIITP